MNLIGRLLAGGSLGVRMRHRLVECCLRKKGSLVLLKGGDQDQAAADT